MGSHIALQRFFLQREFREVVVLLLQPSEPPALLVASSASPDDHKPAGERSRRPQLTDEDMKDLLAISNARMSTLRVLVSAEDWDRMTGSHSSTWQSQSSVAKVLAALPAAAATGWLLREDAPTSSLLRFELCSIRAEGALAGICTLLQRLADLRCHVKLVLT